MSDYHQQRAQEIVRRLLYVTVATASSVGEPWNSPVYSAYDRRANFYWTSSPLAQHSRNIDQNGKAFLAIYDSTVPAGKGGCLRRSDCSRARSPRGDQRGKGELGASRR